MKLIHEYIELFSLGLVVTGWALYILGLMSFLSARKRQIVRFVWLYKNRRAKVERSFISACAIGFICYVYFDPASMSIYVDAQRKEFALYLMYQLIIGGFAMFFFDIGGDFMIKRAGASGAASVDYQDNGETIQIDAETVARELKKAETKND